MDEERRKNPSRKITPPADVDFRVLWDGVERRWNITRNGSRVEMFSPDKSAAISLARAEALREIKEDAKLVIVITSIQDGRVIHEMHLP